MIYLLRNEGRLSVIKLQESDPFKDKPLNLDVAKEIRAVPGRARDSARSSPREKQPLRTSDAKMGPSNSRENLNGSMHDLRVQGEDDPSYKEKVSNQTTSTRALRFTTDNDLYNSERILRHESRLQDKQVKQLKDGQHVLTSSKAIHRDDFIAVSIREDEP